jgi:hypothetical protein
LPIGKKVAGGLRLNFPLMVEVLEHLDRMVGRLLPLPAKQADTKQSD